MSNVRDQDESELEYLGRALFSIAGAVNRLGNADAATPMGGLEALGAVIKESSDRIADALDGVATAIEQHGDGES